MYRIILIFGIIHSSFFYTVIFHAKKKRQTENKFILEKIYSTLPAEDDGESAVISKRKDLEGTEMLRYSDCRYFVLDENECMWTKMKYY